MKDYASKSFRGRHEFSYVDKLARLPTSRSPAPRGRKQPRRPPARRSLAGDSSRGGATVETLLEILSEPIASPALRAAAFNALAEIPRIGSPARCRRCRRAQGRRDRLGHGTRIRPPLHLRSKHRRILASAEMIFAKVRRGKRRFARHGVPRDRLPAIRDRRPWPRSPIMPSSVRSTKRSSGKSGFSYGRRDPWPACPRATDSLRNRSFAWPTSMFEVRCDLSWRRCVSAERRAQTRAGKSISRLCRAWRTILSTSLEAPQTVTTKGTLPCRESSAS